MCRSRWLAFLAVILVAPLEALAGTGYVRRVTLPLVLSLDGADGARWTTELVLVNAGSTRVDLSVHYAAVAGGGSGDGSDHLAPFEQRVLPDAIGWLRELGLDLPEGAPHSGTLTAVFRGSSDPNLTTMSARITTPSGNGRAGLAMRAFDDGWEDRAWIPGLHEDATRRSNLALLNFGNPGDADLVLEVRLFAGDGSAPFTFGETLHSGEFRQIDRVLARGGIVSGFVEIERVAGAWPFLAYATVIDRQTNDPALVLPQMPFREQVLPEAVDSPAWRTELVLTNTADEPTTANLHWSVGPDSRVRLGARQQVILPDLGAAVRQPWWPDVVRGPIHATTQPSSPGLLVSALVVSRGTSGRYGVGIDGRRPHRWDHVDRIFGLSNDVDRRSSLIVGSWDPAGDHRQLDLRVEVWDGDAHRKAADQTLTLDSGSSVQFPSALLTSLAPGVSNAWVNVTQSSGWPVPFFALSVVNDGPADGSSAA